MSSRFDSVRVSRQFRMSFNGFGERSQHEPVIEAILNGAKARLRPITMTSLASILGLLPMALGMGTGSEANIPLGRAVIGGQIVSTLLNFFVVPCLFMICYKFIAKKPTTEKAL